MLKTLTILTFFDDFGDDFEILGDDFGIFD